MRQFGDARSRTLPTDSRDRGALVGGTSGTEAGRRGSACVSGAPGDSELAVPGMRSGLSVIRPSRGTTMATSGHLPISNHSARPAATHEVRRAWSAGRENAVGRAHEPLYRAHGTVGD